MNTKTPPTPYWLDSGLQQTSSVHLITFYKLSIYHGYIWYDSASTQHNNYNDKTSVRYLSMSPVRIFFVSKLLWKWHVAWAKSSNCYTRKSRLRSLHFKEISGCNIPDTNDLLQVVYHWKIQYFIKCFKSEVLDTVATPCVQTSTSCTWVNQNAWELPVDESSI